MRSRQILQDVFQIVCWIFLGLHTPSLGQTASTGALMGEVVDLPQIEESLRSQFKRAIKKWL
jgi:hypothetical protein